MNMTKLIDRIKEIISGKEALFIFLFTLIIHNIISIFILSGFMGMDIFNQPDALRYHQSAVEIAQLISEGVFTFEGVWINSWYTIILGFWYWLTFPSVASGAVLGSVFAGITAIGIYLLTKLLGVKKEWAIVATIISTTIYPSYLYLSSYTLRDTLIVPLVIWSLYLLVRLSKNPSWIFPVLLSLNLFLLFKVKHTIAVAFFVGCILAVPLITSLPKLRRLMIAIFLIALFAIIPIVDNRGLFGYEGLSNRLNFDRLTYLRDSGYTGVTIADVSDSEIDVDGDVINQEDVEEISLSASKGAHFEADNVFSFYNVVAVPYSFATTSVGPFPWQMHRSAHYLALLEVILWWVLLFFIIRGFLRNMKKDKIALIPFLFALTLLFAISIISNNYGADMRFRMPAFMALIVIASFGFENKKEALA